MSSVIGAQLMAVPLQNLRAAIKALFHPCRLRSFIVRSSTTPAAIWSEPQRAVIFPVRQLQTSLTSSFRRRDREKTQLNNAPQTWQFIFEIELLACSAKRDTGNVFVSSASPDADSAADYTFCGLNMPGKSLVFGTTLTRICPCSCATTTVAR